MTTDNVAKFLALAPLMLPKLIGDRTPDETEITDDSAILYFSFEEKQPLNWVMDMLEDDMELTLLYHAVHKSNDKLHHCCFFSNPQADRKMYKFNLISDDGIQTAGMTVSIYDSLDVMESELESDLTSHSYNFNFIHAMDIADVLSLFCSLS